MGFMVFEEKRNDIYLEQPKNSKISKRGFTPLTLPIPAGIDFSQYDFNLAGESYHLRDYSPGEIINHVDGITLEEAEHMMATRLWQNTAKVHFDATYNKNGKRLIYGGHLISMARALSFNGLANAQCVIAINAGSHANPSYAGETIRAWSEIIDLYDFQKNGLGAIRIRSTISKGQVGILRDDTGKYHKDVVLDLDYWCLIPA